MKLGRRTHGSPISGSASIASASECTARDFGTSTPIFSIASLNRCRSSALSITSALAPIISTPCFFSTPCFSSAIAVLSAVWPPSVGRSASGFSAAMIFSTTSQVIGST